MRTVLGRWTVRQTAHARPRRGAEHARNLDLDGVESRLPMSSRDPLENSPGPSSAQTRRTTHRLRTAQRRGRRGGSDSTATRSSASSRSTIVADTPWSSKRTARLRRAPGGARRSDAYTQAHCPQAPADRRIGARGEEPPASCCPGAADVRGRRLCAVTSRRHSGPVAGPREFRRPSNRCRITPFAPIKVFGTLANVFADEARRLARHRTSPVKHRRPNPASGNRWHHAARFANGGRAGCVDHADELRFFVE